MNRHLNGLWFGIAIRGSEQAKERALMAGGVVTDEMKCSGLGRWDHSLYLLVRKCSSEVSMLFFDGQLCSYEILIEKNTERIRHDCVSSKTQFSHKIKPHVYICLNIVQHNIYYFQK